MSTDPHASWSQVTEKVISDPLSIRRCCRLYLSKMAGTHNHPRLALWCAERTPKPNPKQFDGNIMVLTQPTRADSPKAGFLALVM